MADESLNDMIMRYARMDDACRKLDDAHTLVKQVSLEDELNLPEFVYPFKFVRKLAQCRIAAHKTRKAFKRVVADAVEKHEAQQRAERVQFRRARDLNTKYKKLSVAIANLEQERVQLEQEHECILNNMHAYGVEVSHD